MPHPMPHPAADRCTARPSESRIELAELAGLVGLIKHCPAAPAGLPIPCSASLGTMCGW